MCVCKMGWKGVGCDKCVPYCECPNQGRIDSVFTQTQEKTCIVYTLYYLGPLLNIMGETSKGVYTKGQLISKQIYEVIVFPKKRTKYCKDFCPNS